MGRPTLMVVPSRQTTLPRRDGQYFVPVNHLLQMDGMAALTRLHALKSTSLVIIGQRPSREDVKAYLDPEEMRKRQSSPFTVERMSSHPELLLPH
jgi:hypothetical protein